MLARSQARLFFLSTTLLACGAFGALMIHSFIALPEITNAQNLDPLVVEGKHVWDRANCMGCHTLLGEGGYYAPELTKVYDRRGPDFIRAIIRDPAGMYPGQRQMVRYDFTDHEIDALIAFFQWIGEMDLNGYPPEPVLFGAAAPGPAAMVPRDNRPQVFNQLCVACHSLYGQGGVVGPALDGVGDRLTREHLERWLDNPALVKPGTAMPDLPLTEAQISELAAFLSTLSAQPTGQAEGSAAAPPDTPAAPAAGSAAPNEGSAAPSAPPSTDDPAAAQPAGTEETE